VAAFVSPGIDDKEYKDEKPQNEQEYRYRLVFPKQPYTSEELVRIHSPAIYTRMQIGKI
jgi:hypothetical protein